MEKIKFEKCPLCPGRFDILNLESEKKEISFTEGAPRSAPSAFWGEKDSEIAGNQ
jgi:hypothetical protein